MNQIRLSHLGAVAGLLFGWLVLQYGVIRAVFVLAVGAVGWLAGRVLDGDVDLSALSRRRGDQDFD